MSESRLKIEPDGEVTNIQFVDRNLLDEGMIHQIGQEILGVIERESTPKILINFDNVDHLSSAALGTLITINNKIRQKDGQLHLSNINPQIYEVFAITKLNKLFKIHETADEAMSSFS
jgi:anti-sigma B factor antagonist